MQRTVVIGNISLDLIHRPGHLLVRQLGGATLHLAVTAARVGLPVAPPASADSDLARLPVLDWPLLHHAQEPSAAFTIHYDAAGTVTAVDTAQHLTAHAVGLIDLYPQAAFHISCRHSLNIHTVLSALAVHGCSYSLDLHLPSAPRRIPTAVPCCARPSPSSSTPCHPSPRPPYPPSCRPPAPVTPLAGTRSMLLSVCALGRRSGSGRSGTRRRCPISRKT